MEGWKQLYSDVMSKIWRYPWPAGFFCGYCADSEIWQLTAPMRWNFFFSTFSEAVFSWLDLSWKSALFLLPSGFLTKHPYFPEWSISSGWLLSLCYWVTVFCMWAPKIFLFCFCNMCMWPPCSSRESKACSWCCVLYWLDPEVLSFQ